MLLELSVMPVGAGESMGDEIARLMKIIDSSGLPYRANPMGTVIEGEWDELMSLAKRCHEDALASAPRVFTTITIDDRPSKPPDRIVEKLKSVEKRSGLTLAG